MADGVTLLDAARGLIYGTAYAADNDRDSARVRRMVSESKKFATEAGWQVVNYAMQIMGGIGYTDIYPVERLLRDARLIMIWTGTNEVMDLVIQHEYYKELLGKGPSGRDVEPDAAQAERSDEKVYE